MIRLAELIKERGMTQKEFARELNLAPTTLNNYVKGQREPDLDTIGKFCDFLGCTADYLMGRSSSPVAIVSDEEAALLAAYHAADQNIQNAIDALLQPWLEISAEDAQSQA